jgi:hypothetical protein
MTEELVPSFSLEQLSMKLLSLLVLVIIKAVGGFSAIAIMSSMNLKTNSVVHGNLDYQGSSILRQPTIKT